jgi:hypothetical protein
VIPAESKGALPRGTDRTASGPAEPTGLTPPP